MSIDTEQIALETGSGHRFSLLATLPRAPTAAVLWLPALGVAARHYQPFAGALARHGVATFLHEWRGHGTSSIRAGKGCDWGYRELLAEDLPASEAALRRRLPGLQRIVGGHSLGGQLACCHLGLSPDAADRLWLVASGAPYWRAFPAPIRHGLPLAYRLLPWLARRFGALPGRRIGFGGQEAPGVMADWAATALSGTYVAPGIDADLEQAMADAAPSVRAVVLEDDWLAPRSSLDFLLAKLPKALVQARSMDAGHVEARADHFAWMRSPEAVAKWLCAETGEDAATPSTTPGR
ncbi:alpha/beta hydrolase family protein [Lysobacter sp. A3-1-A15]|uniref:alpha/beta hydrolase family protein n=1 Tax=Novilysobacter viscosus TaxID=3098602 RepID=UPI002EDBA5E3